jgi:UTP--glucose-1-phosphate uridylyltransferase
MADSSPSIRKAVIPAAGLGTRFLPVTKAVPKEMLPLVDIPAIQYVIEEAVGAGIEDVLVITSRTKRAIEDHFDRAPELEAELERGGKTGPLEQVRALASLAKMHYVRQGEALGLGHAVSVAAPHVGDEPFAVLLGDDLIDARDHLLEHMLAVQAEHGGSVIALLDVGMENIDKYGAVAVEPGAHPVLDGDEVVTITGLVEKPPIDEAPSSLAIIGRYVLAPEVFEVLRETAPGRGGEIQLTDALATLVERGEPVHGVVFDGRRYDTGDRLDYLKAVVQLAVERDDLGPPLRAWLTDFVADLPAKGASEA